MPASLDAEVTVSIPMKSLLNDLLQQKELTEIRPSDSSDSQEFLDGEQSAQLSEVHSMAGTSPKRAIVKDGLITRRYSPNEIP